MELRQWLQDAGWVNAPGARTLAEVTADLGQLPVRIDSWNTFDELFDWRIENLDGDLPSATYLGVAVRSFFAQGGRRCYVIRAGDPLPFNAPADDREVALGHIVPSVRGDLAALSATERYQWRGIGHLNELSEVAVLSLPDLPFLTAPPPPEEALPIPPLVGASDTFVLCSKPLPEPPPTEVPPPVRAPRFADAEHYLGWARVVSLVTRLLRERRRDVQLVAALPLPERASVADRDLMGALVRWGVFDGAATGRPGAVGSAFLQLAFPWIRQEVSRGLPEGLAPPDGALAGALARTTLLRGAFRSAAREPVHDVFGLEPELSPRHTQRRHPRDQIGDTRLGLTMQERVSMIGPTFEGVRWLSDVTTSPSDPFRLAAVNRLFMVLVRAAQQAGEDLVFEPSRESAWGVLEERLARVGTLLLQRGALRGDAVQDAFLARCDRTTMSQRDLDEGRLIVEISLQPAAFLEKIRVSFALDESQRVDVLGGPV
jgi:hypothetical protein